MKNKFIYTCALVALFSSSCQKDLLSPVSQTAVTATEDYAEFSTTDRIQSQVLGLYSALKSNNFYGGRYIVYNEIRADNWINQTTNSVTGLQTWNFSVGNSAQEVTNFWSAAYIVINRCNLFIDGMAARGASVIGEVPARNLVAEARFLRAVSYYSLLQLYARPFYDGSGSRPGLPLRLTGNKVAGNYDLARSTAAQVYDQILADLNAAETDLPLTNSNAYNNTTRAHRNSAIAFKTRVYLTMQRYADVITEANKIVSSTVPFKASSGVAHELQADVTNVFKSPYTTTESIFSIPFVLGADQGAGQSALSSYFFNVKEYYLNTSGIIADATWKTTDRRRTFIITASNRQYVSKFPATAAQGYVDYVPVIRYAEVLLNLAEARARSTNSVDAQALALLNAVRQRSDATTVFTAASFASTQAFFDAFLKERNIEFLCEGLRNPDLMRLGLTIPTKGNIQAMPPSDARYIWPISTDELLNNNLMTDNN